MEHCLRFGLAMLSLASLVSGFVYQCEPGTDPAVCGIWNFHYNGNEKPLPEVNISAGVTKIRFGIEQYYYDRESGVTTYDAALHSTVLRNPTEVQMMYNRIEVLYMPTNLRMGEFERNSISKVIVDRQQTYELVYLDLLSNHLRDISNLTALVRLQTLNLEGNMIATLNGSVFSGMHNLTMLYLGGNGIIEVQFSVFPRGLANLWLTRNMIRELNLTGASLPALTLLDLENNELTTIAVPTLFATCPALRVLPIALNPFPSNEGKRLIGELKLRNVSHYLMPPSPCSTAEFEASGICFPGSVLLARSIWKAFVLLAVAVLLVAIFVGSIRWIWYQMRY